jgi:DUF4097 and DUF4098 domain-containing protein YvlB
MKWMLILVVAVLNVSGLLADEWSKRFPVSGRPELRVDANDGAVVIHTWDRKEIEARVTTTYWKIPSDIQVTDRQTGDRVELEIHMPRHHLFSLNFGHATIKVELNVPRELRSDIRTGDGNINVDSIHGETHLATGDGRIDASSLDGSLEAKTGDGNVRVQGRFDVLNLHTGDGSIEAEIAAGSKMTSEWTVRTGDGHVTLRMPAGFSAYLDVHTGDGHIQSDLPVTISGTRLNEHELRGNLNAGGPALIVHTNDGSIRLEKL